MRGNVRWVLLLLAGLGVYFRFSGTEPSPTPPPTVVCPAPEIATVAAPATEVKKVTASRPVRDPFAKSHTPEFACIKPDWSEPDQVRLAEFVVNTACRGDSEPFSVAGVPGWLIQRNRALGWRRANGKAGVELCSMKMLSNGHAEVELEIDAGCYYRLRWQLSRPNGRWHLDSQETLMVACPG